MLNIKSMHVIMLASVLVLTSCTSLESFNRDDIAGNTTQQATILLEQESLTKNNKKDVASTVASADGKRSHIFQGTDKVLKMPKVKSAIKLTGDSVMLNFEKAPLEEVVHGILGDILKLDYVIDGAIPGDITLRTQAPVPRDQLLSILESMLQNKKIAMVLDENKRYFIGALDAAKNLLSGFDSPEARRVGYSHVIVPLEYIGAIEMAEILKPVATESAILRIDSLRNLLVLAGSSVQVDSWLQIIETFDVDLLAGMSVAIFPIEHSNVEEVTLALTTLLASGAEGKGNVLSGLIRVVPLETLGSILVVTPRKSNLEKIKAWIGHLDRAPDYGVEPQLFVYKVQNGSADHLAGLLSNIFGGSGSGANRGGGGVAPGLTPTSLGGNKSSNTKKNSARKSSGSSSFSIGDSTRVIADDVNNAILVYATHSEYQKIESALNKLDATPLQVLIEASIIEVTLTDELKYGIDWDMNNNLGNGWTGTGHLQIGKDFGPKGPGFSYSFMNPLGDLKAVLNTLAAKDLVRVLSTPSIMVLDNQQALIHVGTQQPVRSTQTITDGGTINNSVTYRDTGVKLDVQPSVNASGLVTMDIKQSVTDINVPEESGDVGFFERNIESRVAVRSGEAVVLGGLISTKNTTGKDGIPFLHKLPIIGNLFGTTSIVELRTELLVIITPYVVQNDQDLRNITQEMRDRLKSLSVFDEMSQSILAE